MIALLYLVASGILLWRAISFIVTADERRNAALLLFLIYNFMALLAYKLGAAGAWFGYPLCALALILAWPWAIARSILIPTGRWWLAYHVGSKAWLVWSGSGGGAVAGAWALLRRGDAPPQAIAFLESKLRNGALTSGHIVGAGLLAAARGDRATARRLLESLELLDPRAHRAAHRLARDWLIADAAEAGDWNRVRSLARSGYPVSRLGRFVAAAADRLAGAREAPGDRRLRWLWLAAPRRLRTFTLLRRALEIRFGGASAWRAPLTVDLAEAPSDPLSRALSVHLQLLARPAGAIELADLELLGRAWDAAIESDALAESTLERAAALGARGAETVAAEFREQIESEIAAMLRDAGVCMELLPASSPTLSRAVEKVRDELLSELELAFTALEARTDSERPLPSIDEWRELLALRQLYSDAARLGGLPLRRLAFQQIHGPACNFGAWLWNERDESIVAEVIFQWLLAEATIVGDSEAMELQRRNVAVASG